MAMDAEVLARAVQAAEAGRGDEADESSFDGTSVLDVTISMAGLSLLGFGVSFAIPSLVTAVVGAVPKDLVGIASGVLNSVRQTGAVLGVAVLGTIMGVGASTAPAPPWSSRR